MKTTIRTSLLAITLAFTHSSIVSATTTYTDEYDAGGIKLGSTFWNQTETNAWTFDITDDGYNPATEDISSATVSLNLRDDAGYFLNYDLFWEFAQLSSSGTLIGAWEVDSGAKALTITSLAGLSNTGILSMTLEATLGDFYFEQATLTAKAASAVPGPAAMWLFGSGLLSLAGFARARQST